MSIELSENSPGHHIKTWIGNNGEIEVTNASGEIEIGM
jgi:hypothetical protein